jgi:hypothetical protein
MDLICGRATNFTKTRASLISVMPSRASMPAAPTFRKPAESVWTQRSRIMQTGCRTPCSQATANHLVSSGLPSASSKYCLVKTEDLYNRLYQASNLIKLTNSFTGYQDFNGTYNVDCFDTYNATSPLYADLSVGNGYDRQWDWFLCSGFGWYVYKFLL